MINYWWVTRPKRRLDSIPEVLTVFSDISINQEWDGQRVTHLSLEDALENAGLKRIGERRDQTGGGARTYRAWLVSLGLIFTQKSSNRIKLTLAGESIMNGVSPVYVLKNQILKYQFPSSYSMGRGVNVSPRFRIRPFRFLLKLLDDPEIGHLTEEEIAKVVVVNAENETEACYRKVVDKILQFRILGNKSLSSNFFDLYAPSKGKINLNNPFSHLLDIANTLRNWLEYTQLVKMDPLEKQIVILDEKKWEVKSILLENVPFIDRPEEHEYFQRKYGIDPDSKKDTRNLLATKTITPRIIAENKIRQAFIVESLVAPISRITPELIKTISEKTGFNENFVEEMLTKHYPKGAIGSFMTKYFEMAFSGRQDAINFEKATAEIFEKTLGFEVKHIGQLGLSPDVLVISRQENYAGIIDNKAVRNYTISNDHRNRMIQNYILNFRNYCPENIPLKFFAYISGGYGNSIDSQINSIIQESSIRGCAISVATMINLIEHHTYKPFNHSKLLEFFTVGRQLHSSDFIEY